MKQTLLDAYHLLFQAAQDYGLERDVKSALAGRNCHASAMRLHRILNSEVVVDNESMSREGYCQWKGSELIQFQESAQQVVQTLEQWYEQMEAWLVNTE